MTEMACRTFWRTDSSKGADKESEGSVSGAESLAGEIFSNSPVSNSSTEI